MFLFLCVIKNRRSVVMIFWWYFCDCNRERIEEERSSAEFQERRERNDARFAECLILCCVICKSTHFIISVCYLVTAVPQNSMIQIYRAQ